MKKAISIMLALTMLGTACAIPAMAKSSKKDTKTESSISSFGDYKHVIIIGIDGLGATFDKVDSPNFDKIFADGAYRYNSHTEYVTVSAQNWGSILTGVAYDVHGFENDYISSNSRETGSENPSIFALVREQYPDVDLVSFNNWTAINHGIIETDINVKKINRKSDVMVAHEFVQYCESGEYDPALMFVQLDAVDHAAHAHGGFSDQYYSRAEKADELIGEMYDAAKNAGYLDDGLFIVVADHGETTDGHGGTTEEESSTIVAVTGKTVNKCTLPESTRNRDVAAIALYALGVAEPDHMTAVVPEGLFGEEHKVTKADIDAPTTGIKFRNFFAGMASDIWGFFSGTNS